MIGQNSAIEKEVMQVFDDIQDSFRRAIDKINTLAYSMHLDTCGPHALDLDIFRGYGYILEDVLEELKTIYKNMYDEKGALRMKKWISQVFSVGLFIEYVGEYHIKETCARL